MGLRVPMVSVEKKATKDPKALREELVHVGKKECVIVAWKETVGIMVWLGRVVRSQRKRNDYDLPMSTY